jgi:hypothetical protein
MYSLEYDRVGFDYLKESVEWMRDAAKRYPGHFGECMRMLAEEIAGDTAKLEADLQARGYLPKAANDP